MASDGAAEREHLPPMPTRWPPQRAAGFLSFFNHHTERPIAKRPENISIPPLHPDGHDEEEEIDVVGLNVDLDQPQNEDAGGALDEERQNVRPPSRPVQRVPPMNYGRDMGQQERPPVYLPEEPHNYDYPAAFSNAHRSFPHAPPHLFIFPPPRHTFAHPPSNPFAYPPPPYPFGYPRPCPFAYPPAYTFGYPPSHPFAYPPPHAFAYSPPHPFGYPPSHPFVYPPSHPFHFPPYLFARAPHYAFDYAPARAFAYAPHAFTPAPPPSYAAPHRPPQVPHDADLHDVLDPDPAFDHDLAPSTSGLSSSRRSREEAEDEEAPPAKRPRWSEESDSD